MINKTDNKDRYDDFSKRIKEELENHRMPVDDNCWNEIEICMKPKKTKMGWWVVSSVAAVAILVLLFISYPQSETKLNNNIDKQIVDSYNETKEDNIIADKPVNKDLEQEKTKSVESVKILPELESKKLIAANNKSQLIQNQHSDTTNLKNENEISKYINQNNETIAQVTEGKQDSDEKPDKKESNIFLINEPTEIALIKRKKSDKWLLAAAIGSGGNIQMNNSQRDYIYSDISSGGVVNPEYGNNNILSPEDFSDISYSTPLSFGITVRKDFNKHIGIESGLIYTYLSSNFDKSGVPLYTAKLHLHYLGVPINVVAYLWNDPKWNVYISAGGMVEKGLTSIYNQNIHRNNEIIKTAVRTNIDGLQWSVNSSLGISYRFYENWSFYFEPRISYFFDNNQPISIRTDNPVVFGINGGLRYEF